MNERLNRLKDRVREAAADPNFIHHKWFVKYHLELVERIARELLEHYPEANYEIVLAMVWVHDYGKILDFDNQYQMTLEAGPKLLREVGFEERFSREVIGGIELMDKKLEVDLSKASLEVKIVSSADAASHHVGPFMPLYWWENPDKPFEQLMVDQIKKTMKDWDRKMVLPEVREAFELRHRFVLEQAGELPDRLI